MEDISEPLHTIYNQHPEDIAGARQSLTQSNIAAMLSLTQLPEGFIDKLREAMDFVISDQNLSNLAAIWHVALFKAGLESASLPLPKSVPQDIRAMFQAVVLTTGIDGFLKVHKKLGIPESVTRDCLKDVSIWAEDYKAKNGIWGFAQIDWLTHTFAGRLFRLGRLQFMFGKGRDFHIYRHADTRRVLAFAAAGARYRIDGNADGTNGIHDPNAWMSKVSIADNKLTANPISADGRAVPKSITIDLRSWEKLMDADSTVLEVHIPAGEKMDYQACIDSLATANDFFPRYFPAQRYAGFTCTSWLLDPNLQQLLPPQSNIVRFQKEFYLMPVLSDDAQTFERVFGGKPDQLASLQPRTSLQKALLAYLSAGNNVHAGYGFIPADEAGRQHTYTYLEDL